MEELARLAFDASLRALDKQEDVVRELRVRAGFLLAVSSAAVSLAGGAAIRAAPILASFAIAASLLVGAVALVILSPQRQLEFALDGRTILSAHFERRDDLGDVHRHLVYDLGRLWDANEVVLTRLLRSFRLAAAGLVVEIAFLLVSLAGTL